MSSEILRNVLAGVPFLNAQTLIQFKFENQVVSQIFLTKFDVYATG